MRLQKAMENFYKRWLILGLSIAFMVLAARRLGEEEQER
jgi:hypothetical protein